MAKRPDMQVVGEKIARLRRAKGLCAAAFAREIDQPAWLITRHPSSTHPPLQDEATPIEPLTPSFCLTPDDAICLLDDMLKLTLLPPASSPVQRSPSPAH